jgi:polar amino acid transport system substrate-binding protein
MLYLLSIYKNKALSKLRHTYLACLLALLSAANVEAQEILFVGQIVPPLIVLDDEQHKSGALVELAQALINYTQLDASIAFIPWARAYEMSLHEPNVILLSVLKTQIREPQFQWIGKVHQAKAHLIGLKSHDKLFVSELGDAVKLRVGSVRGYGSATYLTNNGFEEGGNLVLASNSSQLWGLLFNDRVDLVLSNFETSPYEIKSAGYDPEQAIDILDVIELSNELQFATGHNTPISTVKILSEGLTALKLNGTYAVIKRKWGLSID